MFKPAFLLFFAVAAASPAAADAPPPPGAASDVKPIAQEDQDRLNRAIGNPQDAKIKIAPVGQSDKDNLNRAVNWIDKKLGRTVPPQKQKAPAAATGTTAHP